VIVEMAAHGPHDVQRKTSMPACKTRILLYRSIASAPLTPAEAASRAIVQKNHMAVRLAHGRERVRLIH
jgi:hypothetical protein